MSDAIALAKELTCQYEEVQASLNKELAELRLLLAEHTRQRDEAHVELVCLCLS